MDEQGLIQEFCWRGGGNIRVRQCFGTRYWDMCVLVYLNTCLVCISSCVCVLEFQW